MITIKSTNAEYGIKIPTDTKEINGEILSQLLSNVTTPQYYCIIALRYKIRLFNLIMQRKSSSGKNTTVSVVPLLAKINESDNKFNLKAGDRIIIDGSSIERGSHLGVRTAITPDNLANYIISDEELNKKAINHTLTDGKDDTIYCLEFKIVPINDIKGKVSGDIIDPFTDK